MATHLATHRTLPPLLAPLALLVTGLVSASHTMAASTDNPRAGQVIMSRGDVNALRTQAEQAPQTIALKRRSPVFQQDTLTTGANGKAQIRFHDGGLVALKPSSRLQVSHYKPSEQGPDVVMELIEGGFRTLTGSLGKQGPDAYQVKTPVGTIGIRGTLYSALLHKDELFLGTWQGQILVETRHGLYPLGAGADFNFASITHTGFTGLLEPPVRLQPAGVIPAEGTEGDSASDTGNGSSNQNSDSNNDGEEKVVLTPLEREEDTDRLSTFQSNGQLDSDPDLPDNPLFSPDSRFTPEEYNAFITSAKLGGIVIDGQLRTGSATLQSGEEPLFITLTETNSLEVVRFDGDADVRERPSESLDVEWGIWSGTNLTPVQIYPERNSDQHLNITEQALWLTGTPTRSAELANLTGTVHFSGTEAIGFNQAGTALSSASGQFTLDLSSGTVSNGMLEASFGDQTPDIWSLGFNGSIQSGEQNTAIVDLDILDGQHNDSRLNLEQSRFDGILIGDQAEGFVGGFYLIDQQQNTATGAVLLEQTPLSNEL